MKKLYLTRTELKARNKVLDSLFEQTMAMSRQALAACDETHMSDMVFPLGDFTAAILLAKECPVEVIE